MMAESAFLKVSTVGIFLHSMHSWNLSYDTLFSSVWISGLIDTKISMFFIKMLISLQLPKYGLVHGFLGVRVMFMSVCMSCRVMFMSVYLRALDAAVAIPRWSDVRDPEGMGGPQQNTLSQQRKWECWKVTRYESQKLNFGSAEKEKIMLLIKLSWNECQLWINTF